MHKESPCQKPATGSLSSESISNESLPMYQFPTNDTVPIEKLQELGIDLSSFFMDNPASDL